MRSYTVPTLTAMAVGLCLVSGAALAQHRDRDGDRDDRGNVTRQDNDNDRGDRRRGRRPDQQQQQQAPQPRQIQQQRRGWDGDRDNDRRGNWNNGRRDRDARDNRFDNNRRFGDRDRDRRFDNRGNDRRFGDRDRDRRFDNRDRRRGDWAQFRRSYDAPRRFRVGVYHGPRDYSYRRWHHGDRLPRAYFARNYWLTNFVIYGLFAPPPGLMWVRYGPDALLIDTYTGEIVQVRYNAFYY